MISWWQHLSFSQAGSLLIILILVILTARYGWKKGGDD